MKETAKFASACLFQVRTTMSGREKENKFSFLYVEKDMETITENESVLAVSVVDLEVEAALVGRVSFHVFEEGLGLEVTRLVRRLY